MCLFALKSAFIIQNKLHPLLLEVFDLLQNKINSFDNVKALCLDPQLKQIYRSLDNEDLFIINEFYQAKGFRKLHLEVASLGNSMQILHSVFFPDPCFEIPIFGVDLVVISDKISAAIVDLSPVTKNTSEFFNSSMDSITTPKFKEFRDLPDWGTIFSPYVCFISPVDNNEEKSFLTLIEDYLSILSTLHNNLKPEHSESLNTKERFNFQRLYCLHQRQNDKTRSVLTKFFGSSWANRYIDDILFDC